MPRRIHVGLLVVLCVASPFPPARGGEVFPEWVLDAPGSPTLPTGGVIDAALADDGTLFVVAEQGQTPATDVLTAALSSKGEVFWSAVFSSPGNQPDHARAVALGGNVVYVLGTTPEASGHSDVLLLGYDRATGAPLFQQTYSKGVGLGDAPASAVVDAQGRLFVAGTTVGDGPDVLLLAYSPTGTLLWAKTWDSPASAPFEQDAAGRLRLDPAGDLVLLARGDKTSLSWDVYVLKFASADGSLLWQTRWSSATKGVDEPVDLVLDAAGDAYVVATSGHVWSTLKVRGSDGALLWQAYDALGVDDEARAIALDGKGGVYTTGRADFDGDASNQNDVLRVVKRDAGSGQPVWSHAYGATCFSCFDEGRALFCDGQGRVFVAGRTSSPPYKNDALLLALHRTTGVELERSVVGSDDPFRFLEYRRLLADAGLGLVAVGEDADLQTGAAPVLAARYPPLSVPTYQLQVSFLKVQQTATFEVRHGTPGAPQFVAFGFGLGPTPVPPLLVTLDIAQPALLAWGAADAAGTFGFPLFVPPQALGVTVWFQAAEFQHVSPPVLRKVE